MSQSEMESPARPVRSRPRWVLPVLSAAVVLAVGTGTVLATQIVGNQSQPPSRDNGQAAPIGVTAPGATASATGSAATKVSNAPANPSRPDPAPDTKTVKVGAVTLSVPTGWTVSDPVAESGLLSQCVAHPGGSCELWITSVTTNSGGVGPVSVDQYASLLQKEAPTCVKGNSHGTPDTTTTYEVRQLGTRSADYRAYTMACERTYHYEQWTVPTWPPVQLTTTDYDPAVAAAVDQIVGTATFSQPSGPRVMDFGYLVGHSTDSKGVLHIKLDRAIHVYGGADNGHDVNSATQTYDYKVNPSAYVSDNGMQLCGVQDTTQGKQCPLSTVLSRLDSHQDTGVVLLDIFSDGTVRGFTGEYRP